MERVRDNLLKDFVFGVLLVCLLLSIEGIFKAVRDFNVPAVALTWGALTVYE